MSSLSGWVFLPCGETLFRYSRARVIETKKKKRDSGEVVEDEEMVLEASPKWEVLSEILSEIRESTPVVDPGRG